MDTQKPDHGGGSPGSNRDFSRWALLASVPLEVRHPGGSTARLMVRCRNLSRGGMEVLHNSFIHPGAACRVVLTNIRKGPQVVPGRVVRCVHRRGTVHQVGIRFDRAIAVREFLAPEAAMACLSLERVDPALLEGMLLHVEAVRMHRQIVRGFLRETRLGVRAVKSAGEAADAAARGGCDVVLCDDDLPDGPVEALARRLRAIGVAAPLIVTTCDDSVEVRRRLSGAAVDAVLVKPLSREVLLRSLGEFLIVEKPEGGRGAPPDRPDPALAESFAEAMMRFTAELEAAIAGGHADRCRAACLRIGGAASAAGHHSIAALAAQAALALEQAGGVEAAAGALRPLIAAWHAQRHAA